MNLDFEIVGSLDPFFFSESFISLVMGPVGSTKTTAGIMKILYHASQMAPCADGIRRSRAFWVRNTREQLRDTSIPDFLKWYPDGKFGAYLKSEQKYVLKVGDIECEVLFRGLDDSNDVRRLLSVQASFFIFDEFREINPDIYNAAQGRLGRYPDKSMNGVGCCKEDGTSNSHLWGMSNPPDSDTFWEDLISNPPSNVHITVQPSGLSPEADWLEFLPDDYYDNLAVGKSEEWVDVFVHAKFGRSLQGKPVFRSFDAAAHVAKEVLSPIGAGTIVIGMDAGLNPTAVLTQQIYDGRVLVLDAITGYKNGMGAVRFSRELLKPLLARKYASCGFVIILDPAAFARTPGDERSVADIMKAEGFLVKPASTNALAARLGTVEAFLTRTVNGKSAILVSPTCTELIAALRSKYRYKVRKPGTREEQQDDQPEKLHPWSDYADALQYACMRHDGGRTLGQGLSVRRQVKSVSAAGWT